jgi:hypothetical protein
MVQYPNGRFELKSIISIQEKSGFQILGACVTRYDYSERSQTGKFWLLNDQF